MNHKPSKKRLQEGDVIRMLFKYFVGNNSQSKRHFMEDIPFSRRVKSKQKQNKKPKTKQDPRKHPYSFIKMIISLSSPRLDQGDTDHNTSYLRIET